MNKTKLKAELKPLSLFRRIKIPQEQVPRPKNARELDIEDARKNKPYWLK